MYKYSNKRFAFSPGQLFVAAVQYNNSIILKRLTKMKKTGCQQVVCGHANKFLDAAQVFWGQY